MANRKAKAQIEIDVSFIGKTEKLYKQIEAMTRKLDLSSGLTKNFSASLEKSFKAGYDSMEKMAGGLSKKGLKPAQYTDIFNKSNLRLHDANTELLSIKKNLDSIFNSPANQKGIEEIKNYQKQLKKLEKEIQNYKASSTRQQSSKNKLKGELGLDYDNKEVRSMLNKIRDSKNARKDYTAGMNKWLESVGLDPAGLNRALELIKQIEKHTQSMQQSNAVSKKITGIANIEEGELSLHNKIKKKEEETYMPTLHSLNTKIWADNAKLTQGLSKEDVTFAEQYTTSLNTAIDEAEEFAQANNTIKEILSQFGIILSAGTVVKAFKDMARAAFDFYRSLDSALNEIYVVSDLSIERVNGLTGSFINMAKDTGMSIDDVTRAAVLFYQQGLKTDEVMEMTEVTAQFAKVAGIDATNAADKLTAAVNGYCLAATDAMTVADKFNKVAAASAADINELSTAFSKAAAQANQAGVGMDNYLAYIATMVEATREAPENIGTSLKTIFSRMQQIKESGTSEDGATTVNNVEEALRSVGIPLRDANNQLRDLEEVFADLGPRWQSLDRNTQAYLGTIIAGTRQQSRFITLMQNWDRVLDLSEQSANSAGQQALMHAKAMESIESKMQQMNVAFQEFVSNLADSDLFKGIISGLTGIVKLFNTGNKPILLVSAAILLFTKRLDGLSKTISKKFSKKTKMKGKLNPFDQLNSKAIKERLAQNTQAQYSIETDINKLMTERLGIESKLADLAVRRSQVEGEIPKELLKEEESLRRIATQNQLNLTAKNTELNRLKGEEGALRNSKNSASTRGAQLQTIGMVITGASAIMGQFDDNMASLTGTLGTATTAIGQFASGNFVGGVVSAATAIYQGFKTISDWDDNKMKKITESIDGISNALDDFSNANTKYKATANLISDYEKLNNKIYRTTEEQEKLNSIVQQMGDSFNVDTIADQYGNLSLNIDEVRQELSSLYKERRELFDKMNKEELDGRKKLDHWYAKASDKEVKEFYDRMISQNRTKYKAIMTGIIDDMTASEREIENSLYTKIQGAFKESVIQEVTGDNRGLYDQDGLAKSIHDIEEGLNNALNPEDWNFFYSGIERLQAKIDTLSWSDFQESMDEMFLDWSKSIGLTEKQWLQLKDVIENTVYGSNNFVDFMNKYSTKTSEYERKQRAPQDVLDRIRSKYAGKDIQKKVYLTKEEKRDYQRKGKFYQVDRGGSYIIKTAKGENITEDFLKKEGGFGFNFTGDLKKDVDDYRKAMNDATDATTHLNSAQGQLAKTIENIGTEDAQIISKFGNLFSPVYALDENGNYKKDEHGMKVQADQSVQDQYANQINSILTDLPNNYNDNEMAILLTERLKDAINKIDNEEVKKQLGLAIREIEGSIDMTQSFTWTGIIDNLKSFSDALQITNKSLEELKTNGYVTSETFADLANTLDNLNFEDIFATFESTEDGLEYINQLNDAIKNLELGYDENNDAISMNIDALEMLQDAQERAAKGKIKNMINDLAASKASMQSQVAYIDAQMESVEALIKYLEMEGDSTIRIDEMKTRSNDAYASAFDTSMSNIHDDYKKITGDSGEWAETTIYNISEVAKAWSKYWQAMRNGDVGAESLKEDALKITRGDFSVWDKGLDKDVKDELSKLDGLKRDSEEAKAALNSLKEYKNKLDATKQKMVKSVQLYDSQIQFLQNLYNKDLSKFGSGSKKEKAVKEYISQLEEVLDLITHIDRETQKLNIYKNLYDAQTGAKAVDNLTTQIKLVEHLMSDYEKGYDIFKTKLNMQAQGIQAQYGKIIKFAEDGSYKIADDAYAALDNDGKKAFDEMIKEYDDLIKKTDEYYNNFIDRMKDEKKMRQDYVDTYIKAEDELVEAIKQREKAILDNKLAAMDKEISAINKAAEARRKAREKEKQAEELSNMQVDLQRALMDSSGASATDILDIQKQIKDKQQDIADKSFDDMVSNMNKKIEEDKALEQRLYDERLEEMDWYWDEVDRIMGEGCQSITEVMTTYMDSFNQASELQQTDLLKGWVDTFDRAVYIGKQGAANMQQVISQLQNVINSVDVDKDVEYLKGTAEAGYATTDVLTNKKYKYTSMKRYAKGGMNYQTGLAWLDGSATKPEAVLNAMETKAFLQLTDSLTKMSQGQYNNTSSNVIIDNISFNVESMSSVADGEKAFDAFVNKFKDIGSKQGISILGTSNRN